MNKHWKSLAAALALVSVLGVAGCGGAPRQREAALKVLLLQQKARQI